MANGADKMLAEAIDGAVLATGQTPINATGLCGSHEPIRVGVHALLLCKQDEMQHPTTPVVVQRPALKFGKLEIGARGMDLTKVLLAVVIVVLLGYEKVGKIWRSVEPDSDRVTADATP